MFYLTSKITVAIVRKINPNTLLLFLIVATIPLLFGASLAFAIVADRNKIKLWEFLGWYTNLTGNVFVLNSIGLLIAKEYFVVAICYFACLEVLLIIYTIINSYLNF